MHNGIILLVTHILFVLSIGRLHSLVAAPFPRSGQHGGGIFLPNPDAAVTRVGLAT